MSNLARPDWDKVARTMDCPCGLHFIGVTDRYEHWTLGHLDPVVPPPAPTFAQTTDMTGYELDISDGITGAPVLLLRRGSASAPIAQFFTLEAAELFWKWMRQKEGLDKPETP